MDSTAVEAAQEKGANIYDVRPEAGTMLRIAQRMLVLESSVVGPLLFRARRSFFESTEVVARRVELCIRIMEQGGNGQDKLQIIASIKAACDNGPQGQRGKGPEGQRAAEV